MKYLISILSIQIYFLGLLNGQCDVPGQPGQNTLVDLQAVNIDPAQMEILVGNSTLVGFGINNNEGGTNSAYIPAGDARVTVSYPSSIISVDLGTLSVFAGVDYTDPWTVVTTTASSFTLSNSTNFPAGEGTILVVEVTGTAVGGSDDNLGLNAGLFLSQCGDVNDNQTASGTILVDVAAPIQLASFTAQKVKEESHLDWVTASELLNSHFDIQHSINGSAFETLGTIQGQGTIEKLSRYAYVHKYPVHGKNYYRLRQVDLDGSTSFSDVRVLEFDLQDKLTVFPNPARSYAIVGVPEHLRGQYLEMFDSSGKRIIRQMMDNAQITLNVEELPSGMYHIKVIESNESARFIKNE